MPVFGDSFPGWACVEVSIYEIVGFVTDEVKNVCGIFVAVIVTGIPVGCISALPDIWGSTVIVVL